MTNEAHTLPDDIRQHSIADVERDTGISKDTLRVWERRYGFPDPVRDALGERWYSDAHLHRLRHVRRLIDRGWRPNRVVALPLADLLALMDAPVRASAGKPSPADTAVVPAFAHEWMRWVRDCDAPALRQAMEGALLAEGLAHLLRDVLPPITRQVGEAWLSGQIGIHQEHLYTETVQSVLRQAIAQVRQHRAAQWPRVVLTTVPNEQHGLGLLMAEALMALEGCETVNLGLQMPLPDILNAASDFEAHVLALSFGGAQNPRDAKRAIAWLRERLPAQTVVWVGGRLPRGLSDAAAGDGLCALWVHHGPDNLAERIARWRFNAVPRQEAE